ncbi:transposase [Candidatus Gottesmanbacteria bacterium]|nr:transposase [Candidatus Gottesmanbacteria bacterium]
MPAKNSYKPYAPDSFYHIYNRGVEKRDIFLNEMDYGVFLSYLKEYLLPKDKEVLLTIIGNPEAAPEIKADALKALRMNNFHGNITLTTYCLMPNHFHLLIHQNTANAIDIFMNSLATRYTMYFNRRYKRIGPLYQSVYKAVLIETDEQLLHLTRYIHRNPLDLASKGVAFKGSPELFAIQPSSYPEYVGQRKTAWVHPEEILKFFSKTNPKLSYQSFVEHEDDHEDDMEMLQKITIDDN